MFYASYNNPRNNHSEGKNCNFQLAISANIYLSFSCFVSEYDISKKLLLHLRFRSHGAKNVILEICHSYKKDGLVLTHLLSAALLF